jgi:hypothetical protein
MFCWGSAGRMRPMRMVWLERNYNEPQYELIRWRKPSLRSRARLDLAGSKVEWDRETRLRFPGETGKWPVNRVKRPKDRKTRKRKC